MLSNTDTEIMAWYFTQQDAAGRQIHQFEPGRAGEEIFFVQTAAGWCQVPTNPVDNGMLLCKMTFKSWGVVLEAINTALEVLPHPISESKIAEPPSDVYVLQPSTERHTEAILLREKDTIRSSRAPDHWIVLTRGTSTQVQVTSSLSAEGQALGPKEIQVDAEAPGEATEEDEDLGQVSKTTQSMSHSTPLPSAAHTEVVQETPTVTRSLIRPTETFPIAPTKLEDETTVDVSIPDVKEVSASQATNDSTQSRGRTPKTKTSAKRSSPAGEDEDGTKTPKSFSSKRRKTEEPSGTPLTRTKKRLASDTVPEKPHVAFSNSRILPGSQFIKHLKKSGGTVAETVDATCDVLCIRDGPLSKTSKLLLSITLGIPIVTDAWLIESTKRAATFFPLTPYIPNLPAQEAEWNFSLSSVWSIPQPTLFQNLTIIFTPALKAKYTDFKEIENVCKAAGAQKVLVRVPTAKDDKDTEGTIVLAVDEFDARTESGRRFNKEFVPRSILRGSVDLKSDEFRIRGKGEEDVAEEAKMVKSAKKKGRPRKT